MKKALLFFLIIGFVACEQKNDVDTEKLPLVTKHDTIKPLAYYPVYPGSYWKYQIIEKRHKSTISGSDTVYTFVGLDTSFVEISTNKEYEIHSYVERSYYDYDLDTQIVEYSDSLYVPILNGEPIYGYEIIDYNTLPPFGSTSYKRYPFLSEDVGFEFLDGWYDPRFSYRGAYNKVQEKTVDSKNDSLIIVYSYYNLWQIQDYSYKRTDWKYYYKNIGLKSHYCFDKKIGDTIFKKELIEYKINR